LGFAIDAVLVVPLSLLLAWIAGALTDIQLPATTQSGLDYWIDVFLELDPAFLGIVGLVLTIFAAYSLLFLATLGRTPGMLVVRARLIDVYGDTPGVPRALLRTAGCFLSLVTLGLGFLWIGVDNRKRGLHDWVAGTHVVRSH